MVDQTSGNGIYTSKDACMYPSPPVLQCFESRNSPSRVCIVNTQRECCRNFAQVVLHGYFKRQISFVICINVMGVSNEPSKPSATVVPLPYCISHRHKFYNGKMILICTI